MENSFVMNCEWFSLFMTLPQSNIKCHFKFSHFYICVFLIIHHMATFIYFNTTKCVCKIVLENDVHSISALWYSTFVGKIWDSVCLQLWGLYRVVFIWDHTVLRLISRTIHFSTSYWTPEFPLPGIISIAWNNKYLQHPSICLAVFLWKISLVQAKFHQADMKSHRQTEAGILWPPKDKFQLHVPVMIRSLSRKAEVLANLLCWWTLIFHR